MRCVAWCYDPYRGSRLYRGMRGAGCGVMVPIRVCRAVVPMGVQPLYLSVRLWSLQGWAGDVVPLGQQSAQSL